MRINIFCRQFERKIKEMNVMRTCLEVLLGNQSAAQAYFKCQAFSITNKRYIFYTRQTSLVYKRADIYHSLSYKVKQFQIGIKRHRSKTQKITINRNFNKDFDLVTFCQLEIISRSIYTSKFSIPIRASSAFLCKQSKVKLQFF